MNEAKRRLPEGVTEEQVTQWVRRHKQVFPIEVAKDEVIILGLFRKPTLADMSAAASVGVNSPMAAGELLYKSCKLAVDPAMDSDDEVMVGAINAVSSLFKVLQGKVGEPFGAGQ